MEARGQLRMDAQLLITNPDMLHRSILPFHAQFARILANLRSPALPLLGYSTDSRALHRWPYG